MSVRTLNHQENEGTEKIFKDPSCADILIPLSTILSVSLSQVFEPLQMNRDGLFYLDSYFSVLNSVEFLARQDRKTHGVMKIADDS